MSFVLSNSIKKKKSIYFPFYTKHEDHFECVFCHDKVKISIGSSWNLRSHLQYKHYDPITICAAKLKRSAAIQSEGNYEDSDDDDDPDVKKMNLTFRRDQARFFCTAIVSAFTVSNPYYKEMIHQINPKVKLISDKTLAEDIKVLYNEIKGNLVKILSEVRWVAISYDGWRANNKEYYSICCHFSDPNGYQLRHALLGCIRLDTVMHDAVNVSTLIKNVIKDWGLDGKIVAAVSDGAALMPAIARELNLPWVYCACHSLSKSVEYGLCCPEMKPLLDKISRIVHYLRTTTKGNTILDKVLKERNQKVLKVLSWCPVRWLSFADCLERLEELREPIVVALKRFASIDKDKEKSKNIEDSILTGESNDILECIVSIVRKTSDMIKELETESKVTLPLVLPHLFDISKMCSNICKDSRTPEIIRAFLSAISKHIIKLWNHLKDENDVGSQIGMACCMLSRNATIPHLDETRITAMTRSGHKYLLKELTQIIIEERARESEQSSIEEVILNAEKENATPTNIAIEADESYLISLVKSYKFKRSIEKEGKSASVEKPIPEKIIKRRKLEPIAEAEEILLEHYNMVEPNAGARCRIPGKTNLWRRKEKGSDLAMINEEDFNPYLRILCLKLFIIPASSSCCERSFSNAGDRFNKKRNRMEPSTIDRIVFLGYMLKKIEGWSSN